METVDSSHTDTCTVTIRSSDVNDNAPNIAVKVDGNVKEDFEIFEESIKTYNGLSIANFTATDKDSGN